MQRGELIFIKFLFYGILISGTIQAQTWGGEEDKSLWSNWMIGVGGGLSSYFGDISVYDAEGSKKLTNESGSCWSITMTKVLIANKLYLSGQFMEGNLKATKNTLSFRTKLYEYNFHLKLDVAGLWRKDKSQNFGVITYAGIGQFFYNAQKFTYNGDYGVYSNLKPGKPEFVFFFGGLAYYKLNQKLRLNLDLSLHQCRTDKMDNLVKSDSFDYFSMFSAGINYYIKSFKKQPLRNKARIANASFIFGR